MGHGGIQQAGKVRNLTPKVETSPDKKKKPTGRAGQRRKYNKLMERLESKTRDGPNKQPKGKLG